MTSSLLTPQSIGSYQVSAWGIYTLYRFSMVFLSTRTILFGCGDPYRWWAGGRPTPKQDAPMPPWMETPDDPMSECRVTSLHCLARCLHLSRAFGLGLHVVEVPCEEFLPRTTGSNSRNDLIYDQDESVPILQETSLGMSWSRGRDLLIAKKSSSFFRDKSSSPPSPWVPPIAYTTPLAFARSPSQGRVHTRLLSVQLMVVNTIHPGYLRNHRKPKTQTTHFRRGLSLLPLQCCFHRPTLGGHVWAAVWLLTTQLEQIPQTSLS